MASEVERAQKGTDSDTSREDRTFEELLDALERDTSRKEFRTRFATVALTALGVVATLAGATLLALSIGAYLHVFIFELVEFLFPGLIMFFGGAIVSILAQTYFRDRLEQASSRNFDVAVQRTIEASDTDEPTMKNLLLLNRQEMAQYHDLTKRQARRSFANSLVAMWAGLLILAATLFVVVAPDLVPGESKLTVAALGGVGTIVSGYITRTFLRQHSLSLQQLNSFFNQPLVSSYLLTAERVASQLEEPDRTHALRTVVEEALAAARADDEATDAKR